MDKMNATLSILREQGLLPLYYHQDVEVSKDVLRALYDAGVRIVEYTNRGSNALTNFVALRTLVYNEMPDLQLGIGTIKTKQEAEAFMNAGADFIVCPIVNIEVAAAVHQRGLLWIPGCFTPSEINRAYQAEARIVKIFPGNILGPAYVSSIKEIFPEVSFMPTGGVEPVKENIESWFNSGVIAVGMGSKLIGKDILEEARYDHLTEKTKELYSIIEGLKKLEQLY